MSRSNTTENARNPSTRWFEWHGSKGQINYWDKEAEKRVMLDLPFTFLLLDELATVKGWHEPSESAIFANEVRDTRQDTFVVKAFKGGELASGLYAGIRDRVKAVGGYFQLSCYIAYKDGDSLKIGNLGFNGAALSAWSEFKKSAPDKTDASGKRVRGFYLDAVTIHGYEDRVKGATQYRIPRFTLKTPTAETNEAAVRLDAELQQFLKDYLGRTRTDQAASTQATVPATTAPAAPAIPLNANDQRIPATAGDGFEDSDIPF